MILTSLPLSAVSPLCRGRNGRLSSRGRCQSPVQRAKKHRSTMYILLVLRERASSVRFLCLGLPSSSYCAWRFLCFLSMSYCVFGRDVIFCFLWGLFVLFHFRLCLFALCSARTCILWAFSLFGFGIDLILRFSGVTLFLWGGVSLKSINQPINLACFVLFQNLAPLLRGGLQARKMEGEQTNTSKKKKLVAGSVRWWQKGVMPVR